MLQEELDTYLLWFSIIALHVLKKNRKRVITLQKKKIEKKI